MPEDFGLVALALIFANLVWNTTALGIDSRLVQRRWLEPVGLSTHLALRISLASLAFVILLLATPLLQTLYPDRAGLSSAVLAYGGLNLLKSFNSTGKIKKSTFGDLEDKKALLKIAGLNKGKIEIER